MRSVLGLILAVLAYLAVTRYLWAVILSGTANVGWVSGNGWLPVVLGLGTAVVVFMAVSGSER